MDRHARAALRRELTRAEEERERLAVVIAYLRSRLQEAEDDQSQPRETPTRQTNSRGPYVGMSSTKAAEKALEAHGAPMKTRDLFETITAGGAKIKNVEGLYKSLTRNKRFTRSGRGEWSLTKWVVSRQASLVG
jgi:hypothetical protein